MRDIKMRKIRFNIPLTILTYFMLWLIGLGLGRLIFYIIFNLFSLAFVENESIIIALRKLIVCGTQIILFFSWVKFAEKRHVNSLGFKTKNPIRSYFTGFIIGLFTITTVIMVLVFTRMITFQYSTIDNSLIIINIVILALGWIIQSASEEIAIRGWLIPSLAKNCTPFSAIFITAIIFGILHLFSEGVTLLSFINLVLSGVFFAIYVIVDRNIWGVCGLHFAWNFALGNIYGLPVSGFYNNGDHIFKIEGIGYNFITGGSFGPEGGLVTTIILLIAIFALTLKLKNMDINSNSVFKHEY